MASTCENRKMEYPIEHYCSSRCVYSSPDTDVAFGLKFNNPSLTSPISVTDYSASDLLMELTLSKLCSIRPTYSTHATLVTTTTGHARKEHKLIDTSYAKDDSEGDDDMDEDDEEDRHHSIPIAVLKKILV